MAQKLTKKKIMKDKLSDYIESTEELIKKNPWTAVAIAVGAGVIVSALGSALSPKNHHRHPYIRDTLKKYLDNS